MLSKFFSEEQLTLVATLQCEANNVMSDAWISSDNNTIPYYRAAHLELGEAMTHLGIKWWKKEHVNDEEIVNAHEQAVLEVVDYMHFSMSDHLRSANGNVEDAVKDILDLSVKGCPLPNVGRYAGDHEDSWDSNDNPKNYHDTIESVIYKNIGTGFANFIYVADLAKALNVTTDHLVNIYYGKNLLNKFRTANGQREGKYCKLWDGREDNEYLMEILNKHGQLPVDEVMRLLTETMNAATSLQRA